MYSYICIYFIIIIIIFKMGRKRQANQVQGWFCGKGFTVLSNRTFCNDRNALYTI